MVLLDPNRSKSPWPTNRTGRGYSFAAIQAKLPYVVRRQPALPVTPGVACERGRAASPLEGAADLRFPGWIGGENVITGQLGNDRGAIQPDVLSADQAVAKLKDVQHPHVNPPPVTG